MTKNLTNYLINSSKHILFLHTRFYALKAFQIPSCNYTESHVEDEYPNSVGYKVILFCGLFSLGSCIIGSFVCVFYECRYPSKHFALTFDFSALLRDNLN